MIYLKPQGKVNRQGFTLIELIVVMAISAAIAGVISMTIMMMWDVVTENRSHIDAVNQVQNAERWMERDAKMAQSVEVNRFDFDAPPNDVTGTLTMAWSEWDGAHTRVVYYVQDDELLRRESVFSPNAYDAELQEWTGAPESTHQTLIARDVVSGSPQTAFCRFDMTSTDESEHIIRFKMTVKNEASTAGPNTETRSFLIKPRAIW